MQPQNAETVSNDSNAPMWSPTPEDVAECQMSEFRTQIEQKHRAHLPDYHSLWQWSVDHAEDFWSELWDYCGVIASHKGETVLENGDRMPGAKWFPEARLNFAENLLRRRDDANALIFKGEDKVETTLSFSLLYKRVSSLAQALRAQGVQKGDRVAGFMPNMPETVISMLATSSIGAIWSSASPDFGVQGVLDRFGQIEPKVVICAEGYFYNGKSHDCLGKLREFLGMLPSVEKVVIVNYTGEQKSIKDIKLAEWWDDFCGAYEPAEIEFEQLPFDHPLYIMFSSGTTGVPKCIVHGQGGTLLQQLKEHRLHCDVREDDKVFYFTTCGWMMWNWLVAGLAAEATLMLYDGSPFYPDGNVLFDYADKHGMTFFGTSAKYIDALKKFGFRPGATHDLSSVRMMTSTGSPLAPESFDYVYDGIKPDIHLASISGGTDIVSCFVLGNPLSPVNRGEIQGPGLGMAVAVFDDDGKPMKTGKGELVCTKPFPSMPVGFWNDDDGAKYRAAYFERFDNTWCHGDWVERTVNGGLIIHGRSDATLNPGGVRIGTAEIYRQVEQIPQVMESIAVGQDWDGDVRVVLFVVLKDGETLDEDLTKTIKTRIRTGCTPRHVPAVVVQVNDIPRTKSGKITELAVRDIIHGRDVKNKEALANPDALDLYKDLPELKA